MTISDTRHERIVLGAKSLAMTALDLFSDDKLVDDALTEFSNISPERSAEILARIQMTRK